MGKKHDWVLRPECQPVHHFAITLDKSGEIKVETKEESDFLWTGQQKMCSVQTVKCR